MFRSRLADFLGQHADGPQSEPPPVGSLGSLLGTVSPLLPEFVCSSLQAPRTVSRGFAAALCFAFGSIDGSVAGLNSPTCEPRSGRGSTRNDERSAAPTGCDVLVTRVMVSSGSTWADRSVDTHGDDHADDNLRRGVPGLEGGDRLCPDYGPAFSGLRALPRRWRHGAVFLPCDVTASRDGYAGSLLMPQVHTHACPWKVHDHRFRDGLPSRGAVEADAKDAAIWQPHLVPNISVPTGMVALRARASSRSDDSPSHCTDSTARRGKAGPKAGRRALALCCSSIDLWTAGRSVLPLRPLPQRP